ncbi:hypothetical protein EDB84DRAFT_1199195 [Lactarius hengduanensis]|nr:hypothetical protein EDB84DRAFT_1199195 [Lactarius hengduanensis]
MSRTSTVGSNTCVVFIRPRDIGVRRMRDCYWEGRDANWIGCQARLMSPKGEDSSIPRPIRFHPHESPTHPILYHHLRQQPLPALYIVAYLPLHPRPPNCASQTSSARVKRRTREQNRSPNPLARNPTVLRTTGYPLHLERGPWSKVQRNPRRPSDGTSVRVRLPIKPIFSISRIMNPSERGVCLSRYPLCNASCCDYSCSG